MFKIKLSPQVNGKEPPVISVQGDILSINGEEFDFSPLQEGESITSDAVKNACVRNMPQEDDTDAIYRKDGDIHLGILYPVFWNSPKAARFPNPDVISVSSGSVTFPDATPDPAAQPAKDLALGEVMKIAAALQQTKIGAQTDEQ